MYATRLIGKRMRRSPFSSRPGSCVFASGTGSLTAFHLEVDVTTTDFVTWFWDGAYWMGRG